MIDIFYVITKDNIVKKTDIVYLKKREVNFTNWFCPITDWVYCATYSGALKSGVCQEYIFADEKNPFWQLDKLIKPIETFCKFKKNACFCNADLKVPKAINSDIFNRLLHIDTNLIYDEMGNNDEPIGLIAAKYLIEPRFELHIDIGKKCNFDCSYCPSYVHDNFSPFLSFEKFEKLFTLLEGSVFFPKQKMCVFTGGEPTLCKDLDMFCNYAKEKKFHIMINTNGSLNYTRFIDFISTYDTRFIISIHKEFTTRRHLEKFNLLVKSYPKNISIKYMGTIYDTYYRENIVGDLQKNVLVFPLYNKNNSKKITLV